jgi:Ner family transcriptional regulator
MSNRDWHPAYIVAELHVRGISLRQLSVDNGFSLHSLRRALRFKWPRAERLIAEAIDKQPHQIWPTRYDAGGRPLRSRKSSSRSRQ